MHRVFNQLRQPIATLTPKLTLTRYKQYAGQQLVKILSDEIMGNYLVEQIDKIGAHLLPVIKAYSNDMIRSRIMMLLGCVMEVSGYCKCVTPKNSIN